MSGANRACVFLDVDVLLRKGNDVLFEGDLCALAQLKNNHHRLFLCTSLPLIAIPSSLIRLDPDGVVSVADSYVIAENRILFSSFIPYDLLHSLVTDLIRSELEFSLDAPSVCYCFNGFPSRCDNTQMVADLDAFERLGKDLMISRLSFYTKKLFAHRRMYQQITNHFELISYSNGLCEATPGLLNKVLGMRLIIDTLKLSLFDTFSIGDASIFNCVKTGIAFQDTDEDTRKSADYVTDSSTGCGVAEALRHFNLI